MPHLLYFGRDRVVLEYLVEAGCIPVKDIKDANVVVVESYDNRSLNLSERLTGTIGLMVKPSMRLKALLLNEWLSSLTNLQPKDP